MGKILLNLPSANARTPEAPPSDFMPIYTRLLYLAGIWPPRSERKRNRYRYYSIFIAMWLGVNCLGELGGLIFTQSLDAFGESVCSTVFRGLAFCEVVSFAIRPTRVQKMFDTLADIVSRSHGVLDSPKVQECPKVANRFSLKFLKGMGMYFIFSSTGVVFQPVMLTLLLGRAPKPFLASGFWLFGVQADGFVSNTIIYTSQSISQFLSTLVCVTYECFAVSLTYYGACQARALCHMLSSLELATPDSCSDPSKPATYERSRSQLVYCIRLHQDIIRFSDEIRSLFEEIVLIQFMASLSFIATLLYQVAAVRKQEFRSPCCTVVLRKRTITPPPEPPRDQTQYLRRRWVPPTNFKFVAVTMILICSNTQVLGYCWSSTQLTKETAAVGSAAFSSSWISAPSSIRRMLIPMLMRSSKASSLWCWKLSPVQLHTWIQILNKAYSFYALMRDRG